MEPTRGTFSEKEGEMWPILVPTKSFYSQSQQLLCMYFSLCAKAHSPPSIIPFPLAHIHSTLCLVPSDVMMILLINKVKVTSI